ncbi:MAG TPA: hypothetical protein PK230_04880 [Chitinophagales bacterium]|nr:hypothetical protein [Chitinophagales bacterium]
MNQLSTLILTLLFLAPSLVAQDLLQIEETEQNGKHISHNKRNVAIDVNSKIAIRLNKQAIQQRIQQVVPANTNDTTVQVLLSDLEQVNVITDQYLQHLTALDEAIKHSSKPTTNSRPNRRGTAADNKDLEQAYANMAQQYVDFIDAVADTPIEDELNDELDAMAEGAQTRGERTSIFEQYNKVFEVATRRLNNNRRMADTIHQNDDRYYIRVGAWLVTNGTTRPIHLQGFDELAEGQRYEVSRNQLNIQPQQQQQLAQYKQIFAKRQVSIDQVLSTCKKPYVDMIDSWLVDVRGIRSEIEALIDNIENSNRVVSLKTKDSLDEKSRLYIEYLDGLKNKYIRKVTGGQLKNLLALAKEDLKELQQQTLAFMDIRRILTGELRTADPSVNNNIQNIVLMINNLLGHYEMVKNYVKNFALLTPGDEVNLEALEFSELVFQQTIDEMPDSTQFDMLYTGSRKQGDWVIIKIAAEKGRSNSDKPTRPTELETHSLRLLNVPAHIDMVANYAFARPMQRTFDGTLPNGPAYSLIVKPKSRSQIYRNYIDAGAGLNFSTFDFDRDGNPEIAAGAVVSCFRDYLQGGVGYNFSRAKPYFHAGLRIPIPSTPIGFNNPRGSNTNTDAVNFEPME